MHHKWQSYDVWFLRYGTQWTELFVIWDHFLPLYPSNNPKKQHFNHHIIILQPVLPKIMIICNTVPEIWCMTILVFILGYFLPFYPLKTKISFFKKNKKNAWRYHPFTHEYLKLWSHDVQFLRYGARWMDRQMNGQKKWHLEVGAPAKKYIHNPYRYIHNPYR